MSTRSQLRFVQTVTDTDGNEHERTAQVYRHSDGYPSAVIYDLATLRDVQADTNTTRGPSYAAGNFIFLNKLRGMAMYVEERAHRDRINPNTSVESFVATPADYITDLDQPHFLLGYGVEDTGDIHGDEEYLYKVHLPERKGPERLGPWTVAVSDSKSFPRFADDGDDVGDRFERADYETMPLDDALQQYVTE